MTKNKIQVIKDKLTRVDCILACLEGAHNDDKGCGEYLHAHEAGKLIEDVLVLLK